MTVDKRRTLWDRLTGANVFVPNEDKYYNPFKARIGSAIQLDMLDFRGVFYSLKRLEILDRNTGILMADYHLESSICMAGKEVPEEHKKLILRTVPRGESGKSKIDFRIVALSLFYECARDDDSAEGLMEGVNDSTGEFVINAGTPDEKRYFRMGGLKCGETVNIQSIRDAEGDVETRDIELWSFSRTTEDEAKQEVNEYLYVQKDSDGWIQVFIGKEVPPERINV